LEGREKERERERENAQYIGGIYNLVQWCKNGFSYESELSGVLGFTPYLQFKLNRLMCHYKGIFMVNRATKMN
jgi:hypothetical protein